MDIAAVSMAISTGETLEAASVSVTKKAMDLMESQGAAIVEQMAQLPPPTSYGHALDIRV